MSRKDSKPIWLAFGIISCLFGVSDFYAGNYGWAFFNLAFALLDFYWYFE